MRLPIAIAAVFVLAGCQRSHAPLPPVAAPAAVATASAPAPPTELPKPPISKKKKPPSPVLAPIVKSGSATSTRSENDSASNDDPCAGLDDAALDDCLARDEADQADSDRDRRPELDPRDRELIDAEAAAARDRDGGNDDYDADAGRDYPPPGDDPSSDEDLPPDEDPPDEYLPDENSYEPLPDDPYNR